MDPRAKLKPAARVAGKKQDVWYVSFFKTYVDKQLIAYNLSSANITQDYRQ